MSAMSPEFIRTLVGVSLTDIYAVGFLDRDESLSRLWAQFRLVYFEFGKQLVEMRCIEDTGTIALVWVDTISDVPDLDDDMEPCVMSLREVLLTDPDFKNEVVDLRLWGASFDCCSVICSAIEFELDSGQVLFVDPTYHFGMKIGGADQRQRWFDEWPASSSGREWTAKVGRGADLYELVFEGLTEVSANVLIREIAGHPVALPAESDSAVDNELGAVSISSSHALEGPHLRILRYAGSTYDIELNFIVSGAVDPGLDEALHSYASRIAYVVGAPSYYAGLEPARDEDTRLFTGVVPGPLRLVRSGPEPA